MYPFKTNRLFVKNAWYVAALSSEVNDVPFSRTILGDLVLFYRDEAGIPVALQGLCPHRRLPLDMGKRVGDSIQCGYHGIVFGRDGVCQRIPSQDRPKDSMNLRNYPVVEKWKWVWVWTGDPDLADPGLLPDHDEMGLGEGWEATEPEYYPVGARFQLLIENLLDLSHISFLHGSYIQDEAWYAAPVAVEKFGRGYVASRRSVDSARSDFHEWMFGDVPDRVDQDLRTVFVSPALMYSGPIVREVDETRNEGRYLGAMLAAHAVTPETATSSHYFSTTTRDFRLDDDAMTSELHGMDIAVRMQDIVALNAIETHLKDEDTLPPEISVPADTPALHIRRVVETMLKDED